MKAPLTEGLAGFVAGFGPEALPAPVLERTRMLVLDGTSALLAATQPGISTNARIMAFAREQGGRAESSLIGQGARTSAVMAALANGTLGYACDVEPHHPEAILHPIAVMVPTSLAVGERIDVSGADFLAAVAIGCEVEYRISMALGPAEQYALGFHPSAICGTFGAGAAAAFLLGLDAEACVRALGLAACQASGLMAWEDDPSENSRPFQMGLAARNGVTAALLAERGFGGPPAVLDHGHTIFKAFSRAPRPGFLLQDLGERFDGVMELAIKPYCCVSFLHPGLDALRSLVAEHEIRPEAIERVVLRFPRSGVHCIDGNPLKSHCAQYVLAVVLARGRLNVLDLFEDRRQSDPLVRELSQRVLVEPDDGELERLFPDRYATEVVVEARTGATLSRRQDVARGYPETPMTEGEILAKFRALAGTVADAARIEALERALAGLADAPDLEAYAALLRGPGEEVK